uniref:Uncharacterized protein n=1 Tax=Theileria annulata TaxID=5874 RepID=A0A3B0MFY2_THEAN
MEQTKNSSNTLVQSPLSELPFDHIIKYSYKYAEDPDFENFKESDKIQLFLKFLSQIWSYLTDSSLYNDLKPKKTHKLVPFMESDSIREQVCSNIFKFLDNYREEVSPNSKDNDSQSLLTAVAQGHLLTCFKLLSSLIMYNDGELSEFSVYPLTNLVKVFMKLVPSAVDLSTLLDFLTDLVKNLSHESCLVFGNFVVDSTEYFSKIFEELELNPTSQRLLQTCGAKLIGLVKVFESNFDQFLRDPKYSNNLFHLRFLLAICLPISHLGICNRQSVTTEPKPVNKVTQEEWNRLERTTLRSKCESISDYEIATYESLLPSSTTKVPPNQIYDIKSYLNIGEKTEKTGFRSVKMPTYEVYSNFCDLYTFLQNPEIILVKTQEYVEELQKNYTKVLSFVNTLAETSNGSVVLGPDLDFVLDEFDGGMCEFANKAMDLTFWSNFLVYSCLSFQNLKSFHKKSKESTTYQLLKDRCATVLDNIYKNVWATIFKIRNLAQTTNCLLDKEQHWINWKLNGCSDELEPVNDSKFELVRSEFSFVPDDEDLDEPETEDKSVLTTLRELEKISHKFGDKDSSIGVNYVPMISDMELNKESNYWYIQDSDHDFSKMSCDDQLLMKFNDYCKKLDMDEDPENDISENERSKNNPLFKFRFTRLFGKFHLEKFMEMSRDDLASGSVESMLKAIRETKGEAKVSPTRNQKK